MSGGSEVWKRFKSNEIGPYGTLKESWRCFQQWGRGLLCKNQEHEQTVAYYTDTDLAGSPSYWLLTSGYHTIVEENMVFGKRNKI